VSSYFPCHPLRRLSFQRVALKVLQRLFLCFAPAVGVLSAQADTSWTDPHPMRLEALIDGRDFTYNWESFTQRFSFRHLSDFPAPGTDGLYGTGGSATGDELFLDVNLQKTLYMDNDRYAVIGRMQRREDFDGRFDRQLVGISRRFGEQWSGAFLANVSGDKGRVDLQYEADWRPQDGQFLRMALIQVDRFYNSKTGTGNAYGTRPLTGFIHYRQPLLGSGHTEFAVNYSPDASYQDNAVGQLIRGNQVRAMAGLALPLAGGWQGGIRVEFEDTDRRIRSLAGTPAPEVDSGFNENFAREMHRLTISTANNRIRFSPQAGITHFRLDETGWIGRDFGASGEHLRRETLFFLGGLMWQRELSHWEPTLYAGTVEFQQQFPTRADQNRDRKDFIAKLSMPWRYIVHQQSGAILTVNPTFRLHRLAFGGGNVQLHWPF
jgi:hypothetical protein